MIQIRPFEEADAAVLGNLFYRAVHEIASHHYSAEQVRAWSLAVPDAEVFRRRAKDGRALLVAANAENQAVAYADLETSGHIDHFYCLPEHTRTVVAPTLYKALEAVAVSLDMKRLWVEASEPALKFFQRRGFTLIARQDFPFRGVVIHNYRMEKSLP